MIKSGLVSISFRNLTTDEIISAVKKSNLKAIEWGGDIHVPHGDKEKAEQVRKATLLAGIEIAAYGSYYKAGESEVAGLNFSDVLESAVVLGAPTIRVWAGCKDSKDADNAYRKKVADDLNRIGNMAKAKNITISLEYHIHTLTDSTESAVMLNKEVSNSNVLNYWQPPVYEIPNPEEYKNGLNQVLHNLSNVHVYHWTYKNTDYTRYSLETGAEQWKEYFDIVKKTGKDHYALLEYIKDDSLDQLEADATILNKLVG